MLREGDGSIEVGIMRALHRGCRGGSSVAEGVAGGLTVIHRGVATRVQRGYRGDNITAEGVEERGCAEGVNTSGDMNAEGVLWLSQ